MSDLVGNLRDRFSCVASQITESFSSKNNHICFFVYRCEVIYINTTSHNTTLKEYVCKWDYNGQGFAYQIVAGPIFIVIYTFSGIFIGFAADRYNRKMLLGGCLLFWSVMTLLTGFIDSYWQLVILRFGLGLG